MSMFSKFSGRHPVHRRFLIALVVFASFYFLLAEIVILNAQPSNVAKPITFEYFLDVMTGEDNRRMEITISAAYLVIEHPPNIRHYKLDIRTCLKAGLQRQVIQWDSERTRSQIESYLEAIGKDVVACMQRLSEVTITDLKLMLLGVKDKGPFKVRPLPKPPERPLSPEEIKKREKRRQNDLAGGNGPGVKEKCSVEENGPGVDYLTIGEVV